MTDNEVETHYTKDGLYQRIMDALVAAGKDTANLQPGDLDAVEHFHGRGMAATAELAENLTPQPGDEILDIGSGVGGPARYFAHTYGCSVTGIDLTAEFCAIARRLNADVRLADKVKIEQGSATNLPFDDARFDAAYSQNVSMNIADKDALFAEAYRVLRPGGLFALSELALADGVRGDEVIYPTPWSADGVYSFLMTEEQTVAAAKNAGFEVMSVTDNVATMRQFYQAQRDAVARHGPPKLGPFILMGDNAKEKGRNAALNVENGLVRPLELVCRRP